MPSVTRKIDIACSIAEVWEVLAAFGRENKMLTAMWSLSDSLSLTVMVMADVKDDEMSFGDAVSVHFKQKF